MTPSLYPARAICAWCVGVVIGAAGALGGSQLLGGPPAEGSIITIPRTGLQPTRSAKVELPPWGNSAKKAHPLPEMVGGHEQTAGPKTAGGEDLINDVILLKVRKGSHLAKVLGDEKVGTSLVKVVEESQSGVGEVMSRYGVKALDPVFRARKASSRRPYVADVEREKDKATPSKVEREDLFRWHRIRLPAGVVGSNVVAELRALPEVEAVEESGFYRPAALPSAQTDPGFAEQWHFAPAKVPETWQLLLTNGINPGGSRDVVIAVVDSGVDYTHPDLQGNMWVNGGENPGNGVDDDNNGYVDDIHGCNTAYDYREHSGDCSDIHGHGTHVAGIAAGVAYNQQGGVGVAFNSQIMGVRAGRAFGFGVVLSHEDIAEGILYAVDNGADVINMSFGGWGTSLLVEDALAVAFGQCVLVAAAGNSGAAADSSPFYPAAYPWILGVMATDRSGNLASFSNYDTSPNSGMDYEVAAPGVEIYSTTPGNHYAKWSGTSMAAPIVSGVAALLRSHFSDRSVYSSRFIMGQIAGTATKPSNPTVPPIVDPPGAIYTLAKPRVVMTANWLLDDTTIHAQNNDDGNMDAGETIQFGIEVRNLSGNAGAVRGVLVSDTPYVTVLTNTASFNDMGSLGTGDNGFLRDGQGMLTRITSPFVVRVATNCPNALGATFTLYLSCSNRLDLTDPNIYTSTNKFDYLVLRGRETPRIVDANLDMTADDLWIVAGPMMIEANAIVRILPGTHVQFGGISGDPYNPGVFPGEIIVRGALLVEGTAAAPVNLYPSPTYGSTAKITMQGGKCTLKYARIRDPYLSGSPRITSIDHCFFDWDGPSHSIQANAISSSIFYKLRYLSGSFYPYVIANMFKECLFDASWLRLRPHDCSIHSVISNCALLRVVLHCGYEATEG